MMLIEGMRIGALVVIALSIFSMAKPLLTDKLACALAVFAGIAFLLFPRFEPLTIIGTGVLTVLLARSKQTSLKVFAAPGLVLLAQLFWVHFKAGAFVFGTGLAIIPVLQADVVEVFNWLTNEEFLDAIAFGQITPGPVTISSVFIGNRVAGVSGALAALVGMYLPGLFLVMWVLPWIRAKVENANWLRTFQRGALAAVIGCLFGAAIWLGRATLVTPHSIWLFVFVLVLSLRLKLPSWSVIPLSSLLWVAITWAYF